MRQRRSVLGLYWYNVAVIPLITLVLVARPWPRGAGGGWWLVIVALLAQAALTQRVIRPWTGRVSAAPLPRAMATMYLAIGLAELVPFLTLVLGRFRLDVAAPWAAAGVGATWVLEVAATLPFLRRILASLESEPSGTAPPS